MDDRFCYSVGLGGDGDEVAVIEDVEDALGVRLDYRDAPNWITAGDVFASVQKQLTPEMAARPDVWARFSEALAGQSGVDPALIEPGSPLLLPEPRFWARMADASALLWFGAALVLIGYAVVALV